MSNTLEGGMNQLCKVCGEPAAGFHFGAFTCEGCKSFFGRTYNNLSSISECKNNGQCIINKKNRTACKACRLRKCLLVGMSKSGSRYGRRSNWFKIHCLLQEQQQQQQQMGGNIHLRSHPYLPLFRNPSDARSSESDSGASSADPEDGVQSAPSPASTSSSKKLSSPLSESECFLRRYNAPLQPLPLSPAAAPTISPRWLPPLIPDVWLRRAEAAPEQNEPIDLSVKQIKPIILKVDAEKEGRPLDLTLDRDNEIMSN